MFPQSRSSENLVYLILPLAIVSVILIRLTPTEIVASEWISLALLAVSGGALILYMYRPVRFLLKWELRRRAYNFRTSFVLMKWWRTWDFTRKLKQLRVVKLCSDMFCINLFRKEARKKRLVGWWVKWWRHFFRYKQITQLSQLLRNWHHELEGFELKENEEYAKVLIANAVSSTPIQERCDKVRSLVYFLVAYWFYVYAGFVILRRIELNQFLLSLFIISVVIAYPILILIGMASREYAKKLVSDVIYIAEFTFVMTFLIKQSIRKSKSSVANSNLKIVKKQKFINRKNLSKEMNFLDGVLARGDVALFDRFWHDLRLEVHGKY